MKNILILFSLMLIGLSQPAFAQQKQPKTITTTFWVASACAQCEATIEKAMDTKGVITSDYNLESGMLTVTYKPKKITETHLHELLNEAGYDTDKSKCTDEQYSKVHSCCRYRELEKH